MDIIPNKYWIYSTFRTEDVLKNWLLRQPVDPTMVEATWGLYMVGATREKQPIFWQIDENMLCRAGKVVRFDSSGHRLMDGRGGFDWMHVLLKSKALIPLDWKIDQCLFGQHLLSVYQDKTICVVQDEATALICASMDTRFVWVALGEGNKLCPERLEPLRHKDVILMPNRDQTSDWESRMNYVRNICRTCYLKPIDSDIPTENTVAQVLLRKKYEKSIKRESNG